MKILKNLLLSGTLLFAGLASAAVPSKSLVPIEDVFTPKGFDDNDDVEIVVAGYLPNLCYKSPYSKVVVKKNKILVQVGSLSQDKVALACLQMVVPFVHVVHVGLLKKGTYNVIVNGNSDYEKAGELTVGAAGSEKIDDFVYAAVENVLKGPNSRIVTLQGYNPSDCFELDEIKVISNSKNTYSVLPKMKQVSDFCPMKMIPFNYKFEVPNAIDGDKVLLHVRAMDGKSVNTIFDNKSLE